MFANGISHSPHPSGSLKFYVGSLNWPSLIKTLRTPDIEHLSPPTHIHGDHETLLATSI